MSKKTFYTKNICSDSYTSVSLICKVENRTKAFKIFDKYINEQLNDYTIIFTKNSIKELIDSKVKCFISD